MGGKGTDRLRGGDDGSVRDVFVFTSRSHSTVGVGHDTVENFRLGVDDMDLDGIDAKSSTSATNEDLAWGRADRRQATGRGRETWKADPVSEVRVCPRALPPGRLRGVPQPVRRILSMALPFASSSTSLSK